MGTRFFAAAGEQTFGFSAAAEDGAFAPSAFRIHYDVIVLRGHNAEWTGGCVGGFAGAGKRNGRWLAQIAVTLLRDSCLRERPSSINMPGQ
ncbi:MAG: hypothetical protein H6661_08865 [Ardenticatenaceae bacterium]|nr:hypothetical protein [Ardenticatenaceae bacterium]